MLESKECAEVWKRVVQIYDETRDKTPIDTMNSILNEFDLDTVTEVFATVSNIKKHDGRIYGENRKFMDSVLTNPKSEVWEFGNPMLRVGLDDIHTSHINQLITELRKALT